MNHLWVALFLDMQRRETLAVGFTWRVVAGREKLETALRERFDGIDIAAIFDGGRLHRTENSEQSPPVSCASQASSTDLCKTLAPLGHSTDANKGGVMGAAHPATAANGFICGPQGA